MAISLPRCFASVLRLLARRSLLPTLLSSRHAQGSVLDWVIAYFRVPFGHLKGVGRRYAVSGAVVMLCISGVDTSYDICYVSQTCADW